MDEREFGEALEKARAEVKVGHRVQQERLVGSLVYGGPMTRRWKTCLDWVRDDLQMEQGSPVLREIFELTAPRHWAFYLHPTRGWLKYDMRQMYDAIKASTEVEHE